MSSGTFFEAKKEQKKEKNLSTMKLNIFLIFASEHWQLTQKKHLGLFEDKNLDKKYKGIEKGTLKLCTKNWIISKF